LILEQERVFFAVLGGFVLGCFSLAKLKSSLVALNTLRKAKSGEGHSTIN
jgi:hypothetical protein